MKQTIEINPCIHFDIETMQRKKSCPNVMGCCDEKEDKQGNTCSDRLMDCTGGIAGGCHYYDSGEQP